MQGRNMADFQSTDPSYIIVTKQLQDLVRVQQLALTKLRSSVERTEGNVPPAEYDKIQRGLEDERLEHLKTKTRLAGESEKLQFALGEVEILDKQLQREKHTFENAFGNLKNKAIQEAEKSTELHTKYLAVEELCEKQDDVLFSKENKIKDLKDRLSKQKENYQQQMSDMAIQMQQEKYIVQNTTKKTTNQAGISAKKQRRVTFR